jgi:peptide chain release factor 2
MGAADFWDNPTKAQKTIASLKPLNGLLKPYDELHGALGDVNALGELVAEDASLEDELVGELSKAEGQLEAFELKAMLNGPQDASNALVRIQAGAGGTDACDWAAMLARMYGRWAERRGMKLELIDTVENIEAGFQSVEFRILGDYAYGYLQSEIGVHRLVRISPFGAGDTRQTSFAAVDVLPELDDDIEIVVRDADLEMQTFCSGGPGGQHQNKTQSGVRLIHKPTGVRGESRTEKSQLKNKENALKLVKARLYAIEEQKRLGDVAQRYDAKGEVAFGSQIRSYVLQPYTLAKDERDGVDAKTPQVHQVLDGDIDLFMQAYLRHKTARLHKRK